MVRHDPDKHHRRSVRLKGHDYRSEAAYFVTICTQGREPVLDDPVIAGIIGDVWQALPKWFPTIALDEFVVMPNHVHFILWIHPPDEMGTIGAEASPAPTTDDVGATLAVAPDHPIAPNEPVAPNHPLSPANALPQTQWTIPQRQKATPNPTLGEVVGAYKSLVFQTYLGWVQINDPARWARFWQRNYYEHIIRNEGELQAIRRYIRHNPENWALDRDNPQNTHHLAAPKTVAEYLHEALTNSVES
jgi:putative transposase